MTTNTEYRNELGDTTTDPAVADGWSDAALEVDERDGPDAPWRPSNYEGEHAVTAERIAHYAAREAAIAAPPRQAGVETEVERLERVIAAQRAALAEGVARMRAFIEETVTREYGASMERGLGAGWANDVEREWL